MKVLVTGHRGYLGVEMVPILTQRGHEVVGLDVDLFRDCDFLGAPDRIPTIETDIRDVTPSDLGGFDAVIHLAALCNDPLSDLNPVLTREINYLAAVRLAAAAKAAGVRRFLFSSSCSLYGKGGAAEVDEESPVHPLTVYGKTKVLAERAIARLADADFAPVFLRNATAYGVSRRLRADVLVNNLVGSAVTSGKVVLTSDGTASRPLVHVLDIAQCFAELLTAPTDVIRNQCFNVAAVGQNFSSAEVARLVAEVIPRCTVETASGAVADPRDYRVDFGKLASAVPSFRPQWTVRQGIEQLWAAFSGGGLTLESFAGPRYFRLRMVRRLVETGELSAELRQKVRI